MKNSVIFHFLHQSLNHSGRWGTTDDFTTSFLHFSLFTTALWDLANSRPVYSLMLSSHLFFCLPCLLPPFTVPCNIVLTRPDEQETCPYHCNVSLYDGQEVFTWSDCLLDLGTDFLTGNTLSFTRVKRTQWLIKSYPALTHVSSGSASSSSRNSLSYLVMNWDTIRLMVPWSLRPAIPSPHLLQSTRYGHCTAEL